MGGGTLAGGPHLGYPPSRSRWGPTRGTPLPGLGGVPPGVPPHLGLGGGPTQSTPPSRSRWGPTQGTPLPGLGGVPPGVPPHLGLGGGPTQSTPHPGLGGGPPGVPPPRQGGPARGTPPDQHSVYLLHGGRYASCVHAGGLSCICIRFQLLQLEQVVAKFEKECNGIAEEKERMEVRSPFEAFILAFIIFPIVAE